MLFVAAFAAASSAQEEATGTATTLDVVISVADQRMVVLRDGMWVEKYKISTSKFGLGDSFGSYKTPLGRHRICDKIGHGLPPGAVIKHRNATGEILPVNAPGRDPIVTRILWLEGLEQRNANAKSRGIYIHGTVEEDKIGQPVSYGCIRMRSRDVVDAFDALPVGTVVTIQQEKLPHYKRWSAPPMMILASRSGSKSPVKVQPDKEKAEGSKPDVKLVAAKTGEAAASKHSTARPNSAAQLLASHRKGDASTASDSEAPSAPAEEPRVMMGGSAAIAALKGSILFSDLPGHGPNVEGLKPRAADPQKKEETASEEEAPTPAAQLPRVTFRAATDQGALR